MTREDYATDSLEHVQRIRNRILEEKAHPSDVIRKADAMLYSLANRQEVISKLKECIKIGPLAVILWYAIPFESYYSNSKRLPISDRIGKVRLVLLREAFIDVLMFKDPWQVIDSTCDIQPLKTYVDSGCENLDIDNKHMFYHDIQEVYGTWLFPLYESIIVGFLLALIASGLGEIAGVIFQEWRRRKNTEKYKREIENVIAVLQIESMLRVEILLKQLGQLSRKVSQLSRQMNQTMEAHNEMIRIYSEEYLPVLEKLRESKGENCPVEFEELQYEAKKTASRMINMINEFERPEEE